MLNPKHYSLKCAAILSLLYCSSAYSLEWSDTSVNWRWGQAFKEPFNSEDIQKNSFGLMHIDGNAYGTQFLNIDFLQSSANDPKSLNTTSGAQELYMVYRNTLDIEKLTHKDMHFGLIKGLGATIGFDWNTKSDVGYNSRKRMLVVGPTLMWDVPGHLNTSLLFLKESNAPSGAFPPISNLSERYNYSMHPMISLDWGIPITSLVSFEGYANFIASKGKDEVGNDTGLETNIDAQLMFDLGSKLGYSPHKFRVGFEYQYWNNKFGNTSATTNGNGYSAHTPMIRAEYHF